MDLIVVVQVETKIDVRPTVTRMKSIKRSTKKKKEEVTTIKIVTLQMLGAIMEQKDGEYAAKSANSVGSVDVNLAPFFVSVYQPITETAIASSKSDEESNTVQIHQTFEPSLARF
jgi:ABC-type cobalt transport system substrate-binding protein